MYSTRETIVSSVLLTVGRIVVGAMHGVWCKQLASCPVGLNAAISISRKFTINLSGPEMAQMAWQSRTVQRN